MSGEKVVGYSRTLSRYDCILSASLPLLRAKQSDVTHDAHNVTSQPAHQTAPLFDPLADLIKAVQRRKGKKEGPSRFIPLKGHWEKVLLLESSLKNCCCDSANSTSSHLSAEYQISGRIKLKASLTY